MVESIESHAEHFAALASLSRSQFNAGTGLIIVEYKVLLTRWGLNLYLCLWCMSKLLRSDYMYSFFHLSSPISPPRPFLLVFAYAVWI